MFRTSDSLNPNHQDRYARPAEHGFRHASQEGPREAAAPVTADHDEIGADARRGVENRIGARALFEERFGVNGALLS